MSIHLRHITRCFRTRCVCVDYIKNKNCYPDTKKEYEICYNNSIKKYNKVLDTNINSEEKPPHSWYNIPLL